MMNYVPDFSTAKILMNLQLANNDTGQIAETITTKILVTFIKHLAMKYAFDINSCLKW